MADQTFENKTFTSTAGPLQTKRAMKALADLLVMAKHYIEMSGTKPDGETPEQRDAAIRDFKANRTAEGAACYMWSPFDPTEYTLEARAEYNTLGEKYGWTVTATNHKAIIAEASESMKRVAPMIHIKDGRRLESVVNSTRAFYEAKNAKRAAIQAEQDVITSSVMAKRPAGAVALIVAILHESTSDSQSDYFGHASKQVVAIGWRTSQKEDFRQLRRAAVGFQETAHLDRDECEHRDNYSMGHGNYLKDGYIHDSGWCVESCMINANGLPSLSIDRDAIPFAPPTPPAPTERAPHVIPGEYDETRCLIARYVHTKKGTEYFQVELLIPSSRGGFEMLRDDCKARGGWYSRAWSTIPGGFAFERITLACAFAAAHFPAPPRQRLQRNDGLSGLEGRQQN